MAKAKAKAKVKKAPMTVPQKPLIVASGKPTAVAQMKAFKAELDRAPSGMRKEAAQRQYAIADAAMKENNDRGILKALEEAKKFLRD
ncbi:MAG: hypothetical protein P1V34_04190 [Alphaproteobacteria bacterium]|nr:hypothetical protein [Alphaproteobacteria bacterium]